MHLRYHTLAAALTLAPLCAAPAAAQSAGGNHVALGDQAHAAMNPAEALRHYELAIEADSTSYEALWKAARDVTDLAQFEPNGSQRKKWFRTGERYARRALAANPRDAEGHFHTARAIGLVALSLGKKDRVKFAGEVRTHALEALKLDPNHAGALHVMGVWNAEVMRLSGVSRFMAKNFLGGKVFDAASWQEARRYLEKAVEVDPDRLTHHLDLGEIYEDRKDIAKAREQYELVARERETDFNDKHYKKQAEAKLAALK